MPHEIRERMVEGRQEVQKWRGRYPYELEPDGGEAKHKIIDLEPGPGQKWEAQRPCRDRCPEPRHRSNQALRRRHCNGSGKTVPADASAELERKLPARDDQDIERCRGPVRRHASQRHQIRAKSHLSAAYSQSVVRSGSGQKFLRGCGTRLFDPEPGPNDMPVTRRSTGP
jgi:hypothetical protein